MSAPATQQADVRQSRVGGLGQRAIAISVAVAVAVVAGIVFLSTRSSTSVATWQNLPSPAIQPFLGKLLAEEGGTGSGAVVLSGLNSEALAVAVTCEGAGDIRFSLAGVALGGAGCFAGQSVQYQFTTSGRSWSGSTVTVLTTSPDLMWRVRIGIAATS